MLVQRSKANQAAGSCLKCLYVHRGSFKGMGLAVLVSKMNESQALSDKLFVLNSRVSLVFPSVIVQLLSVWFGP